MKDSKKHSTVQLTQQLLQTKIAYITHIEQQNRDRIHLYNAGSYWLAFERSAYKLEQTIGGVMTQALSLTNYPLPVVLASIPATALQALCNRNAVCKQSSSYIELSTTPISTACYTIWYNHETEGLR